MAPRSWAGPYLGLQLGAGSISKKLTESTSFDPPQIGHANRQAGAILRADDDAKLLGHARRIAYPDAVMGLRQNPRRGDCPPE